MSKPETPKKPLAEQIADKIEEGAQQLGVDLPEPGELEEMIRRDREAEEASRKHQA